MKTRNAFLTLACVAALAAAACSAGGPAPSGGTIPSAVRPLVYGSPTPPPTRLYVDHYGQWYEYKLPLRKHARPLRSMPEAPDQPFPPQIAVSPYGVVALVTPSEIRLYEPPIVSLTRAAARRIVPLSPAMTEIGPSGADLIDVEFDPSSNLWLFSGLGGEITELRAPLSKKSVAAIVIPFGAPGTKTAAYGLLQGRFDVNSALYVYGQSATAGNVFKTSFPYAKPLSPLNINVAQAAFVDSSQYLPSNPDPATVILGQYFGALASPPPQQPPPQPVNAIAEFFTPLNPVLGLYPNATVNDIAGALAADPPASVFFTLDASDGKLQEFPLPMFGHPAPKLRLPCLAGVAKCDGKSEHLFTAP